MSTAKARTPEQYSRLLVKSFLVTVSNILSPFPFPFQVKSEKMADHLTGSATFLVSRNRKSVLRRFGRATGDRLVDSSTPAFGVITKKMTRGNTVGGPTDIAEQNVAEHLACSECGDATLPMNLIESRLREILSNISFHAENTLTRLLTDSLSSDNNRTNNRQSALMEQLINQSIATKLESSEFHRKIDEAIERIVAAPNVISKLVESVIDSEGLIQPVAVVMKQDIVKELVKYDVTKDHPNSMNKSLNRSVRSIIISHRSLEDSPSLEGFDTNAMGSRKNKSNLITKIITAVLKTAIIKMLLQEPARQSKQLKS